MALDVRMNYPSMEDMSKAFKQAAQMLGQTGSTSTKARELIANGALLGSGGDAFTGAISQKLSPAIKRLVDKMNELSKDIDGAVTATRDGVSTAQSRFK